MVLPACHVVRFLLIYVDLNCSNSSRTNVKDKSVRDACILNPRTDGSLGQLRTDRGGGRMTAPGDLEN